MKPRPALLGGALLLVLLAAGLSHWMRPGAEDAPIPAEDVLPLPPVPPRIAEGPEYTHCIDMLGTDPAGAADFAQDWAARQNTLGARHCQALAQLALGQPETAAAQLQALAGDAAAPSLLRSIALGQAAQAWLMAGRPRAARAASATALEYTPEDPDLLIWRARAELALDLPLDAAADLDAALDADPRRTDALVLHAEALRRSNKLDSAGQYIERAMALEPDNADALLERGILRQRRGDSAGAQADWERTLELAPDSPVADLARQDLALLEAGPAQ